MGTSVLAGYVLRRKLGEGGMGVVYAATNELGHGVAVKVVHPGAPVEAIARLEAEARLARQIHHPNVVEIIAVDRLPDGRMFVAMEFLQGRSLADHLRTLGPFAADDALPRALQLCAGVHAAHVKRILHRDLKPDNVFLCERPAGVLKVLDFGISKSLLDPSNLTRTGGILGTPRYMAPEVWTRGPKAVDLRSDVFALGLILFEMLTGEHPYAARYVRPEADPTVEIAAMVHVYGEILTHRQPRPTLADYVSGAPAQPARDGLPARAARPPRPDITPAWIEAIDAAISIEPSFRPATPRALADILMRGTPYAEAIARVVAPSLFEIAAPEDATRPEEAAPALAAPLARPGAVTATDGHLDPAGLPTSTGVPTPAGIPTSTGVPQARPTTLTASSGQLRAVPTPPSRRRALAIAAGAALATAATLAIILTRDAGGHGGQPAAAPPSAAATPAPAAPTSPAAVPPSISATVPPLTGAVDLPPHAPPTVDLPPLAPSVTQADPPVDAGLPDAPATLAQPPIDAGRRRAPPRSTQPSSNDRVDDIDQ
ncbi:MAG: protein kinase [Kofleriaceae bacterium]|nr:protein kinase [Kofleriaceae bacterium]MBP9856813.1 protein kinase [Kofleriaceae bacterium]